MDTIELISMADELCFVQTGNHLEYIERLLLQEILDSRSYREIQLKIFADYSLEYLQRHLVPKLFKKLSLGLDQSIYKSNIKSAIKQKWQEQHKNSSGIPEEQAIIYKAYEVFNQLCKQRQKIAQRIFIELIELTEGHNDIGRQIEKNFLVKSLLIEEKSEFLVNSVIQILIEACLILENEENGIFFLEINEFLVYWWLPLIKWLNEEREMLKTGRLLEKDAKNWENLGKRDDELLKGIKLNIAESFLPDTAYFSFSNLATEFLQKSIQKRNTNDAIAKVKQSLTDCRSHLAKVQETIDVLEAIKPDSENFLQTLLTLRLCVSHLSPYSENILEIVSQLTENNNLSQ